MQILDSSFVVSFVLKDDTNHKLATAQFDVEGNYLISEYVLAEIHTVLMLKKGYKEAVITLEWILGSENIKLTRLSPEEFTKTVDLLRESVSKLSFVDASLIVMAKNRKLKLLTFDKEIEKRIYV